MFSKTRYANAFFCLVSPSSLKPSLTPSVPEGRQSSVTALLENKRGTAPRDELS